MKFTIERDILAVALSRVAPVVTRNSPHPILSCVKLSAGGAGVGLVGQNSMAQVSQECRASIDTPGGICIPADKLSALVGTLAKGSQVEIERTSDTRVTVRYGKGHVAFPALDPRDYPMMEFKTEREPFTIGANELKRLFDMAIPFVSPEETRAFLNGGFVHGDAGNLFIGATDGKAMVEGAAEISGPAPGGIIIPTEAMSAVAKILGGASGDILVSSSAHAIRFEIGACVFLTRLVDGEYPNYRSVIPSRVKRPVIVHTEYLDEVCRRVQAVTEAADATKARPRAVRLAVTSSGGLRCQAGSDADSAIDETIACEGGEDGANVTLGTVYVLDAIAALGGDGEVEMHIPPGDAPMPILVRRARENDPESVTLMPRRG